MFFVAELRSVLILITDKNQLTLQIAVAPSSLPILDALHKVVDATPGATRRYGRAAPGSLENELQSLLDEHQGQTA